MKFYRYASNAKCSFGALGVSGMAIALMLTLAAGARSSLDQLIADFVKQVAGCRW